MNDKVVIKRPAAATETLGGIILPELAQNQVCSGIVISVTNDFDDDFDEDECGLKAGDLVIFKEYTGSNIDIDNESYTVVDLSDILVKVG